MATVLTAYDLKMGKTGESRVTNTLMQPIQMLGRAKKDDEWKKQNMDWFEQLGIRQLNMQTRRLSKLYKLADGVIDKTDYILDKGENDAYELTANLALDEKSPFELKFYPIIPNVINVLTGEFSKRSNKVLIYNVDEFSVNEMLENKRQMVESFLVEKAKDKINQQLSQMGVPLESEEAQQAQGQVNSLPEIEAFYKKSYKSIPEQWAGKQLDYDTERFKLYELENDTFRDFLVTGREFWHVRLKEDDYDVERWSPLNTFFHKSSSVKYISEGDYAGRVIMMSIPDAINRYGYLMTAEQAKSLESLYGGGMKNPVADGHDFTAHYDISKKPDEQGPNSIFYEQLTSARSLWHDTHLHTGFSDPYFSTVNGGDGFNFGNALIRVSEIYWKSQRKLGHLFKIDMEGNLTQEIVTEDYKITEKGIYDQSLLNQKTKDNLVFGEHIDWIWVNEIWKGIKLSPDFATSWTDSVDSFTPLYLDVKPIKFQFKGISNLYDCRLPIEGMVESTSLTQQARPFQIQYNMVNNQIADILIDELGTVILMDQNALPRQSMGEEWGQNNFQKAYQVMKDFSILPVDTSVMNTDVALNFQHFQKIDLQQDKRLMSRIELANYFKEQCFESVGITRQRAGQVAASESATGVQQAVQNSYAQTEMYFTKHSNFLMPRVKEMMLNAAQYYNATKPSVQLSYLNSDQEKMFFSIEGYKLLLRDFNIICSARPDAKAVMDQLKQLAVTNNTSNATIYDLAKIISADSVTEIIQASQLTTKRMQEEQQAKAQQEQQMLETQIQAQQAEKQAERDQETKENALDRQLELAKAQIQALGFAQEKDSDMNGVPDVLEVAKFNADLAANNQDLLLRQQELAAGQAQTSRDMSLKEKAIEAQKYAADKGLQVAMINKTAAEIKAEKAKKKSK